MELQSLLDLLPDLPSSAVPLQECTRGTVREAHRGGPRPQRAGLLGLSPYTIAEASYRHTGIQTG